MACPQILQANIQRQYTPAAARLRITFITKLTNIIYSKTCNWMNKFQDARVFKSQKNLDWKKAEKGLMIIYEKSPKLRKNTKNYVNETTIG